MKIVRYASPDGPAFGILAGSTIEPLDGPPWETIARSGAPALPLSSARLLAPTDARKVLGIGRNYRAHAAELGNEVPKEPLVFVKAPSALIAHGGVVLLPPEAERVDFEGELAIVIGRRGRRIPKESWRDFVLGFTAALDVTARDLQKSDGQWWRAKGFDTFCPLGPAIETELDASDVLLETRVGGALRQSARTSDMIFDLGTLVAFVSSAVTLEPGDVILTGTPEGVGPLAAGDHVEVTIEGIGTLGVDVA